MPQTHRGVVMWATDYAFEPRRAGVKELKDPP